MSKYVRKKMIDKLLKAEFQLVEIQWQDGGIWDIVHGSRTLACRYAVLASYIYKNFYTKTSDNIFVAQGNSAGSSQIAYVLCYYGYDEDVDLVNLGGGLPPCPRNTRGVPLVQNHLEQLWAILAIKRQAGKDWARWAEPLLFDNPNLYYPKTYVRIYLGDAEYSPECIDMANLYFRAIRSKKKNLRTIKNTSHQIQENKNGVKAIHNSIEEIGG